MILLTDFDILSKALFELNDEEIFYRNYFNAKKDPEKFDNYLKSIDVQAMYERNLWLPEFKETSAKYFTEYFVEDIRKNIEVSKHNRYTPLFKHKHAFFEMVYVASGKCENTVEGNMVTLNKGDICIISPDVNHTMGAFNDDSLVINIIIRKSTFKETFFELFTDDTILSLFFTRILFSNQANNYIIFPTVNNQPLQFIIEYLIFEGMSHDKYYKPAMENLLRTAFCLMLRKQNEIIISNDLSVGLQDIYEILRYIQNNYKTVTMQHLSEEFKYSPDYIGKLIKKNTGITFVKILQDIRFKKACNMLLNTNLHIIDICYEIGYDSVEFFNRTFKRLCGMTPTEYRRKSSEFAAIPPDRRRIELKFQ